MRLLMLAALAAPFALVACGSEAVDGDPLDGAADRLERDGTARLELLVDGKPVGTGVLDASTGRAHLRYDLSALSVSGTDTSATVEMIVDGRSVLVEAGFLVPKLEGKWLRGESFGAAQLNPFVDPRALLAFLRDAGELEERGSERVRGVDTTRFDGVLPASAVSGPSSEDAAFSVWVDGEGRVRRLEVEERLDRDAEVVALEYYDFGAPVEVALPDDADVITQEEFDEACDEAAGDAGSMYCFSASGGVTDYGELEAE